MAFSTGPSKGIAHKFTARLTALEHTPHAASTPSQNLLIFIGGLSDGLLTVEYPTAIASSLPSTWSLAQPILSSSYAGWGTSSLQQDVKELSKCVSYFRGIKTGRIVLLGHSTGCQDVMEYLVGPHHETRAPIDGGILQAPVSDREALVVALDPKVYDESCKVAQEMVDTGRQEDIMPSKFKIFGSTPICARRWLSLASPNHDGDDDYFSSDLSDEQFMKSFGSLPTKSPLCILFSGSDEHMPKTIDKAGLIAKWIGFVKRGGGKVDEENSVVVEDATHNLNGDREEVVSNLVKRILDFLAALPPLPKI
ncbi:Fusarinine C esterase sidJ [Hyphodiscus hymeniophilus]|uniref:Fusarinine C esterase sidJ n=1 Tax=Hyphodiscus hymeniophilus TaxID=353542 RepID=A0A9P6VLG7_9HELO|nr:Fusarinine C esterase sidJ [Hyphodiscus hymeniophilus]